MPFLSDPLGVDGGSFRTGMAGQGLELLEPPGWSALALSSGLYTYYHFLFCVMKRLEITAEIMLRHLKVWRVT